MGEGFEVGNRERRIGGYRENHVIIFRLQSALASYLRCLMR